jgi:hypothetical protein
MTAKIISCLIAFTIHLIIAFLGFISLILAMNGYNDKAAGVAIPAYMFSQTISFIITAGCLFLTFYIFQTKLKWSNLASSFASIFISLIISILTTFISIMIGIGFGDRAFRN